MMHERLPRTSLPVSTPNTIYHSRLIVCLPVCGSLSGFRNADILGIFGDMLWTFLTCASLNNAT